MTRCSRLLINKLLRHASGKLTPTPWRTCLQDYQNQQFITLWQLLGTSTAASRLISNPLQLPTYDRINVLKRTYVCIEVPMSVADRILNTRVRLHLLCSYTYSKKMFQSSCLPGSLLVVGLICY